MSASKRERRDLKKRVKEAFDQSKEYQDLLEQIAALKAKKAQMEAAIEEEYSQELQKIDDLKKSIDADAQMLTDLSLNMLMKGEKVELTDVFDNKYEPEFKVKFKRV